MKKVLILVFSIGSFTLTAQDSLLHRHAQVTFFYPLGTNGLEAMNYTNAFSLNVLYGLNGGLNGVEFGGFVNSSVGRVYGAQFAGVANINGSTADGFLGAGIANVVTDSSKSICAAGISNVIGGNFYGLQMAGIFNFTNGDVLGGQMAGIANASHGDFLGLQCAGIANVNTGDFKGMQGAGIANFNGGNLRGVQMGLINRARIIKGFQLGLINIANDYEKGVPLGLISFVKDGYHALEFAGGEAVYGNVNFKLGVDKLYTIYKLGFAAHGSSQYLTYGLGLGTKMNFSEKFGMSIDGSTSHIIHQSFSPKLDLLSKVDLNFRYDLGEHFDVFVGPSFNAYLSEHDPEIESSALNVPYSLFTHNWGNGEGRSYVWIGANAGVSIEF